MIDPPSKGKGGYWTNDIVSAPATADAWLADAQKHDGSWWNIWPVAQGPVRRESPRHPSEVLPIPRSTTRQEPMFWNVSRALVYAATSRNPSTKPARAFQSVNSRSLSVPAAPAPFMTMNFTICSWK